MSDLNKQVKDMASLIINSNRISEMHERNMKLYPLIFFEGVKKVNVDYDLSYNKEIEVDKDNNMTIKKPTNSTYISYELEIDETKENNNLDKRFEALVKSLKTLLWSDLIVKVSFNGKLMFESKNG